MFIYMLIFVFMYVYLLYLTGLGVYGIDSYMVNQKVWFLFLFIKIKLDFLVF